MSQEVYIKKCEKCGTAVVGIFTSAFADTFTVLYECSQCGHVWSEDKPLSTESGTDKGKKETGEKDTGAEGT